VSPHGVVALVTGGASGLGRATVIRLRDAGAIVVCLDQEHPAGDGDGRIHSFHGDVTDSGSAEEAVAFAERLGELRICVNCAGVFRPGLIAEAGAPIDLDELRTIVEINLLGTLNVVRVAAARMQRSEPVDGERGVIVNTSSVAAFDGQAGTTAYAASKAAVAGITLPLARELAPSLIRCVAVAPGVFETPLLGAVSDRALARAAEVVPHPNRPGNPDEFAALVLHIVENQMLNGEVIRLDGAVRLPA
jgi:NAD(P)-dependent dehydrogenase (short-subunit alcohol dehydrogenase family)